MRAVLFLMRKEFLQILRDRATLFQVLAIPVVQLLVLTNAATFAIRDARIHVVDLDRSATSRGLVDRLAASGRFSLSGRSSSMARAEDALLSGDASVLVHIPPDFDERIARRGEAPVQLVLNAEEGAAAGILATYARRILADYSAELSGRIRPEPTRAGSGSTASGFAVAGTSGSARIDLRTRGWYNPRLDYVDYMVPGILVSLVTIIGTLLTAQNVAREKELGTLEQLNVTPITRPQFIAAKLIPAWLLAFVAFGIGLVVGWLVFQIPIRGSLVLVLAATAVYLVVALGIGLLISTTVETQQQAMFVTFFVVMIYLLMSGLFTPIDSMPGWARWLAELNPMKHFIEIMRAVLLKGAGAEAIRTPLLALVAFGGAALALAVRQYSKTSG